MSYSIIDFLIELSTVLLQLAKVIDFQDTVKHITPFQVYNENLLVTLAVQRYAHALLHETPVEKAPKLFK